MLLRPRMVLVIAALAATACGGRRPNPNYRPDAGDGAADAPDVTVDTAPDVTVDTAPDAPVDTAPDAPVDVAPDAPVDVAPDVTVDTAPDVTVDVAPDTMTCPAGQTLCAGACVNRDSDRMNCGACGAACPSAVPNGVAVCRVGVCAVTDCSLGFSDCDRDFATGCEVDVRVSDTHCGACGNACAAGRYCLGGTCQNDPCARMTCPMADACHVANTCERASGTCNVTSTSVAVNATGASPIVGAPGCTAGAGGVPGCSFQSFNVTGDLAAQANNGDVAAVTSGVLPGYIVHAPENLNDGRYGNGASWVASGPNGWVKVDLGRVYAISRVTFGRDRTSGTGIRDPGRYTVAVAVREGAYAEGDATDDANEYRPVFDSSTFGAMGETIPTGQTVAVRFAPMLARFVKLSFANDGVAVDEVEVAGCDPASPTCRGRPTADTTACDDHNGATISDACSGGFCVGTPCATGFADCNGTVGDACEIDVRGDVANCGRCGNACATGSLCVNGSCVNRRTGAFVYVPGPGYVRVYSGGVNTVRLALDTGTPTPMPLPTMNFTGAGVLSANLATPGVLRMESSAPFQAWVGDTSTADQLEAAAALDGSTVATELFAWAGSAVTVLTGTAAPTSVSVQRLVEGGAPVDVDVWVAPGAGQFHVTRAPSPAVYRVVATGAPVTAFGQALVDTYNHSGYVPADTNGFRGTSFRYAEPTGSAGTRRMLVQALDAPSAVTFQVGTATSTQRIDAAFGAVSVIFPADTLVTASGTAPLLAWIEADPDGTDCDGSLLDADFVPSIRGALTDTEFHFRTSRAPSNCAVVRRADIDVIGRSAGTAVSAWFDGGAMPAITGTLGRGERLRVLTDATTLREVRVLTSAPALVEQSHAEFQFLIRAPSVTAFE